jgi:hypothetical protein
MRRFQRHFSHRVDEVEGKIDQVLRLHTSSSPPVPNATNHKPASTPSDLSMQLPQSSVAETLPRENIPAANLAIAHLGGEDFAYDKSTLQGPPLIHLSGDIERLSREWESSDLLVVNGRGNSIPVKYWGEFFKKSKAHGRNSAWDSIKVEWGNWKVSHNDARQLTLKSISSSSRRNGNAFRVQRRSGKNTQTRRLDVGWPTSRFSIGLLCVGRRMQPKTQSMRAHFLEEISIIRTQMVPLNTSSVVRPTSSVRMMPSQRNGRGYSRVIQLFHYVLRTCSPSHYYFQRYSDVLLPLRSTRRFDG